MHGRGHLRVARRDRERPRGVPGTMQHGQASRHTRDGVLCRRGQGGGEFQWYIVQGEYVYSIIYYISGCFAKSFIRSRSLGSTKGGGTTCPPPLHIVNVGGHNDQKVYPVPTICTDREKHGLLGKWNYRIRPPLFFGGGGGLIKIFDQRFYQGL